MEVQNLNYQLKPFISGREPDYWFCNTCKTKKIIWAQIQIDCLSKFDHNSSYN